MFDAILIAGVRTIARETAVKLTVYFQHEPDGGFAPVLQTLGIAGFFGAHQGGLMFGLQMRDLAVGGYFAWVGDSRRR